MPMVCYKSRKFLLCVCFVFVFLTVLWWSSQLRSIRTDALDQQFGLLGADADQTEAWSLGMRAARSGPAQPQVVFSIGGKPALALFSARYDSQLGSTVLIGYFNNRIAAKPPRVSCRLIMQTQQGSLQSPWTAARSYPTHDGEKMPYDGVLYFCAAKKHAKYHIEVEATDFDNRASGIIEIPVQFGGATNVSSKAAACVPPLRYAPDEEPEARLIMRLVEFIEVNRLLGVDHFFFYNLSLPSNASKVLQHYESIGWASVTQWSLAPGVHLEKDIHYYGQLVSISDCLYAVRDRYRLVAFFDIDEFLVPTNSKGEAISLEEAAKLHDLRDRGGYCALAFRNGVFPPLAESGSGADAESGVGAKRPAAEQKMPAALQGCRVANLMRKQRLKFVSPYPQRTKILAVARQIKEMVIHFVWASWHKCGTKQLDPDSEGLLHHFRYWPAGEMVEDASMVPLRRGIETAVTRARERLKQELHTDICA